VKIYVSGPMRGKPAFNFPAFREATVMLEKHGHEVFSPAARDEALHPEIDWYSENMDGSDYAIESLGFDLAEALEADCRYIIHEADAVCVLPGWEESRGSRAEAALADALGKPVYTLDTLISSGFRVNVAEKLRPHPALAAVQETPRWGAVGTLNKIDMDPPITDIPAGSTVWVGIREDGTAGLDHVDLPTSEFGTLSKEEQTELDSWMTGKGETREVSESGAMKGVKLTRYDLIPVKALRALAEHYGRTTRKYPPNNWRKGFEWSKSYAALLRHATQWWGREDLDVDPSWPEGSPHLAAVAWHALTLLEYALTGLGVDDRPE
jgi:hypothetical protein